MSHDNSINGCGGNRVLKDGSRTVQDICKRCFTNDRMVKVKYG